MISNWREPILAKRLTERDQLHRVMDVDLRFAQTLTNFLVYVPTWLPEDCSVVKTTLRPEQPPGRPGSVKAETISQTPWSEANPCSVRVVITGAGRRLRIKEFLYYWAPPAASIAPLEGPPFVPVRRHIDLAFTPSRARCSGDVGFYID